MISTRDLSQLPNITSLKRLCQSLAMLDAIIEPDWEMRYHSFNTHWRTDEAMASMRDGSGDDYSISFNPAGALIRGFAHESAMSPYRIKPPLLWPGLYDDVPPAFADCLADNAISMMDTTFCIWRTTLDGSWQRGEINFPIGEDPDGSEELLALLDGNPKTYQEWAQDYYERPINLSAVMYVYTHHPLTQKVVTALNNDLPLVDAEDEARTIGYNNS